MPGFAVRSRHALHQQHHCMMGCPGQGEKGGAEAQGRACISYEHRLYVGLACKQLCKLLVSVPHGTYHNTMVP